MVKRKKYPKLPNGFGSIRWLGEGRRNPYAVHPPTTEFTLDGVPRTPKALCYVDDWMKGFAVLTAYQAGTYVPGMEKELETGLLPGSSDLIRRILADYSLIKGIKQPDPGKTFAEVFQDYYLDKFGAAYGHEGKKTSLENSTRAAFKNCKALHDREFASLVSGDLQQILDSCILKHASLELILSLFHQMYTYARGNGLCGEDYSRYVRIKKADDDERGVPFSDQDLKTLWAHQEDETVEMILIMCYSGFRISAYKTLHVNLKDRYFQGGIKTAAGKDRIVPIHSSILGFVRRRMRRYGSLLPGRPGDFRTAMYGALERLGIERHTPHDCRHTFSRLCEKYGVRENDRKRLLGHAFSDVTNKVYGHRGTEELRAEIEKIKICD